MICLQFLRGNDFVSKSIEWYSHGYYSHVDAVLPDGRLLGSRMEDPNGVAIRPSDYPGDAEVRVVRIPCDEVMAAKFYAFVKGEIGKPYDSEAIAGFISGRQWDKPDAWFCSELITAGLTACGYFPYPLSVVANKVSPADLLLMLSARMEI